MTKDKIQRQHEEDPVTEESEESFPASDPPSITQPKPEKEQDKKKG